MKRDAFTLAFPCELIIDNFAGGGTSTGLEAAFGRPRASPSTTTPRRWCGRISGMRRKFMGGAAA